MFAAQNASYSTSVTIMFSIIVIYRSQGSASIETKKSEQKPLLTEFEDTSSVMSLQVNGTACRIVGNFGKH